MQYLAFTAAVFAGALALAAGSPAAHAAAQENSNKVTVQPGDSLSKIAKAEKTTYPRLFYANPKLEHPDMIYAGSELRVPAADEQLTQRPLPGIAASAPTPHQQPVQAVAPAFQAAPQRAAYNPAPAQAAASASGGTWDRLANCESGGNWSVNTGNGYYGGLQFSQASWQAVGGTGPPSQASKAEQIARAKQLQAVQGWGAWPACSAKLGIG